MLPVIAFIVTALMAIVLVSLCDVKRKGIIVICAVITESFISSILAVGALSGSPAEVVFPGSYAIPDIFIRVDALAGWFIVIVNFTAITGALYGYHYMKVYKEQTSNLTLHWNAYIIVHVSMICVCSIQNSLVFLISWEMMTLAAFLLVIFEHQKRQTLKAGINYLIQSHVSMTCLMIGFIWVATQMKSFDFKAITQLSGLFPAYGSLALFFCFFIGFAIKAGLVPFHTWLPYAHPAAPAHISGVMSGVIIKMGIYGILRMVLLVKSDFTVIGYVLLILGVISGIYGVMLAILQHNLKKLLAYHSIENIGIIAIGIGMGCIGLGSGNQVLSVLGFAGALLHTLNHSLFKSLLFFAAGNVYQATHTIDIDKLGGIIKKMPYTSLLFLVASLAICGLPPFNGFISEFLIYTGLFRGLRDTVSTNLTMFIFAVFGLTLIGGLALLCFTKAFGTTFLGNARSVYEEIPSEKFRASILPMMLIVLPMLIVGLFPQFIVQALSEPTKQFTQYPGANLPFMNFPYTVTLTEISSASFMFLGIIIILLLIRKRASKYKPVLHGPTWNCAYTLPTSRLQYTASSFIRSYRKLAEPIFFIHKNKKEINGFFPMTGGNHETHPDDKVEMWLIRFPIKQIRYFLGRFTFLQNGNPQVYIFYGIMFIILLLAIPPLFDALKAWVIFLNNL